MTNINNTRKGFDYNGLPDRQTRATLRQEAAAIKLAVKRTHDNIIEIGNRLIHAKEVAGHGEFAKWIEAEFQMSDRHAQRFMNVAETFGKSDIMSDLNLPNTAIFMLAAPSVSDETRSVAVEMAATGDLKTVSDAKALIEASKVVDSPPLEPDEDPFSDETDDGEPDFSLPPAGPGTPDEFLHPFADVDLEGDEDAPDAEEESDPPSPYFKDGETLEETSSVSSEPPQTEPDTTEEAELTLEQKLAALPLAMAMRGYGHNGVRFLQQASLWHQVQKVIKSAARSKEATRYNNGPVSTAINTLGAIPDPSEWEGCPRCKGSLRFKGDPCEMCQQVGFTTRKGEGVTPDVVTAYAESLRGAN